MNVRLNVMSDMTHDQSEDKIFMHEIPDDVLESAAFTAKERTNNFTQWACTALFFCPGP